MDIKKIKQQLDFIIEIDKVKSIFRKSKIFDGSRHENDAEHSWTICMMAIIMQEHANFEVDITKVLHMLLIHDIVEIDAGDVFLYAEDRADVHEKEEAAAKRIFGILPEDQAEHFINIWQEFEARETKEAKYAAVFDRLEPVLQNAAHGGGTWKEFGVPKEMVLEKTKHIQEGSEAIWKYFQELIEECDTKGYF